jgi:hypothetical protein
MGEPVKWYDDNADNPPWIKALAEVRRLEGWRYHHVQAIIVSIDQYAEAALGNREFFLNKPYGIGRAARYLSASLLTNSTMRVLTTSGSTLTPRLFESKRTPDGVASCRATKSFPFCSSNERLGRSLDP